MTSMAYNSAAGLSGMLREGTRHFSQEDDSSNTGVVLRNIDACLQLARMLSSSLGPQGRCKLIINHLKKIIVTSDCAAIIREVDVIHPAAQLLKQAVEKQETECGDNTAFVLAFGGELLYQTAKLISKMTWKPAPEILAGYELAMKTIEEQFVPTLIAGTVTNLQDEEQVLQLLKPVLASKQYGAQEVLAPLVAKACLQVMEDAAVTEGNPTGKTLSVERIRTVKIMGSSVTQSMLIDGYCAVSGVDSVSQSKVSTTDGKYVNVCVFACGFEASSTEAKGTVLMKNADDLLNYNKTEEMKMSDIVASIKAANVDVVVVGGNVSDMALHYIDKYNIMCLRIGSKWELRRLCTAVHATALVRLGPPTPDEMGYCTSVTTQEIGSKTVTIFQHNNTTDATNTVSKSKLATIVLRASTMSVLNDLERAVDDGVQAISQATMATGVSASSEFVKTGQYVYGGGAFEMSLSTKLQNYATSIPGLEQYAINAFGKALEVIPRTLAENAGYDSTRILADLQAAHSSSSTTTTNEACDSGVDIDALLATTTTKGSTAGTSSMKDKQIYDLLSTKMSALSLAVDAVVTILKIDQIIMSKPSGGPGAPPNPTDDPMQM
jgi:T-complex protein 1 subunit theta